MASASHRCAAISISAGASLRRPIKFLADTSSSLRRHLFLQPPRASPRRAAISSFGRCILIAAPPSLQLAGASHRRTALSYLADVAPPPYHILASALPRRPIIFGWRRRAALSYFGRRIQSPRHHCLSWLTHPIAYFGRRSAGTSHRLFRPPHPIVVPPSLILAGASPCHAAILIFSGVLLPRHHRLSLILAGASHCLTALSYLGWHIPSRAANPISAGGSHRRATICYLGPHVHSMLRRNFLIQHAPYLPINQSAWGGEGDNHQA